MDILFTAAGRALKSLLTADMLVVLIYTVLLTLALLIGFVGGVSWLSVHVSMMISDSGLASITAWGGSIASIIIAWLLFPGIMPLVVTFFDDKIAGMIEERNYPLIPQPKPLPLWPEILHDIGFSLKAIALNILCLPLYLVPVINLFVFYVLNGYLLGREFFVVAARRYMPRIEAEQLRRKYRVVVFIGGVWLSVLATVPVVNLIAPFWGVALMTHLFLYIYTEKSILISAPLNKPSN